MFQRFVGFILFCIYRLLQFTWRIEVRESDDLKKTLNNNENFIVAHWHGHEFGIFHLLRRYKIACITSSSKDGEIMNTAVRLAGAKTSRGSSTRGGVTALKGIVRLSRQGFNPAVAVDGPKGPLHKVKPGIFEISKLTKQPIYPIAMSCSSAWSFDKSWNKARLPKPFSKVTVQWGDQIPSVQKQENPREPAMAMALEKALTKISKQA